MVKHVVWNCSLEQRFLSFGRDTLKYTMNFKRFENCLVADISLRQYIESHSSPLITIIFMTDLMELPTIGFSCRSAAQIAASDMNPNRNMLFKKWSDYRDCNWFYEPVKKNEFLSIFVQFQTGGFSVRFGRNLTYSIPDHFFKLPPNVCDIYLGISSCEIFEPEEESKMCNFALLDAADMVKWVHLRNRPLATLTSIESIPCSSKANIQLALNSSQEPLCSWCCEKKIDTLLVPCGHAVSCSECHKNYISNERKKALTESSQKSPPIVFCPICREQLNGIGRICFRSKKCILCGCNQLSAVAGGPKGCGCVLGCFEKAIQLQQKASECPFCKTPIVQVIHMYLQEHRDN
ncbi:unnamed protein product [Thelazia callipaeda]|uniref:RING-type domain-containing protein n=1 Tax=Thelazia callipaeda TaxID=103827 RepID=A0A0N5CYN1_THECL|nr:unnamed protein product [Thelazia callipaeda]